MIGAGKAAGIRATGVAAWMAVGLIGCGSPGPSTPAAHLLTGEISGMGGACYADTTGHKTLLSYDPMDGTAMFDGRSLIPVMWPVGYTARTTGEAKLEVLDKGGHLVATTGRFYRLIGRYHAGFFQMCGSTTPEEVKP